MKITQCDYCKHLCAYDDNTCNFCEKHDCFEVAEHIAVYFNRNVHGDMFQMILTADSDEEFECLLKDFSNYENARVIRIK